MEEKIGKSIIVQGKVQGVFFRASTLETASKLGINGWVKNKSDGSVEIEAHGELEAIAELVVWCGSGSKFSNVTQVKAVDLPYVNTYRTFEIIHS